jgi:hypothetical protein
VKCYGVPSVVEFLVNDHPKGEVRRIRVHVERFRPVWGLEHGVQAAKIFQSVKAGLFLIGPAPLSLFLGQVVQRVCDCGEVGYKALVEVTES